MRAIAEVSSFARFASSIFPGQKGKRYFLMADIYLDDSGTHEGAPYCFLSGYLASTERWTNFSTQWGELCDKYLNGRPFKASLANRRKDPRHIPEHGMVEFAKCIRDHVEMEIWSALPDSEAAAISKRHDVVFDRYRLCLLGVLNGVLTNSILRESGERIAWTFDHQGGRGDDPDKTSELELSLLRAFNDIRSVTKSRGLLHSISFADDEATPPLQAADFLAWHQYRRHSLGADVADSSAYQILRSANIPRIEVVWFDHKIEDLLTLLAANRIKQGLPHEANT